MKKAIHKLYQTKNGGSLSPQDCLQINAELANLKVEDIPSEQRGNAIDYLLTALNHNSVELMLVSHLDDLLYELQKNT
ncbi:MAG: hypothetical protein EOM12_13965 [Verrucomicrobiae bacterium]|nr:hypothetical protein [Verrucomicrobiae bacterium]